MIYECHITIIGNPSEIEMKVGCTDWHFSKIDGDPIIGKGIKCYATQNYDGISLASCIEAMKATAEFLKEKKCNIIRMKVEGIMFDTKNL